MVLVSYEPVQHPQDRKVELKEGHRDLREAESGADLSCCGQQRQRTPRMPGVYSLQVWEGGNWAGLGAPADHRCTAGRTVEGGTSVSLLFEENKWLIQKGRI